MPEIGRNDPCPCGSGKKFKKCHLGREHELVTDRLERLPDGAAVEIMAMPEVSYGRSREFLSGLDLGRLTGTAVGVKFIDLESYHRMGFLLHPPGPDLNRTSAGLMVNPLKTMTADPNNIYVAISPAVSDSTLIHQLAHILDYLAGSRNNPGLAQPLSFESEAPLELLEHPKEFGDWLSFLANELGVALDAEDAIILFLHERGRLIPGAIIKSEDPAVISSHAKAALDYMNRHRSEIDEYIKNRPGYKGVGPA